jgi:hypothetical protein
VIELGKVANELDGRVSRNAITDASQLKVGAEYWVVTMEPAAHIRAGRCLGFEFYTDDVPAKVYLRLDLPEDWQQQYPDLIFENCRFPDHWALEAWPVEEQD